MAVACAVLLVLIVFAGHSHGGGEDLLNMAVGYGITAFQKSNSGTKLGKTLQALKDAPNKIYDATNKFSDKLDTSLNAVMDYCDGPGLAKFLKPRLNLRSIPNGKCLEGLKMKARAKGELVLTEGKLLKGPLIIEGESHEQQDQNQNLHDSSASQVLYLSFTFPNLKFIYTFKFNPSLTLFNRYGKLKLVMDGQNRVTMRVRVPVTLTRLKELAAGTECYVRVRELDFHLEENIRVEGIAFDSFSQNTLGLSLTEETVKKLIPNIKGVIRESVQKTLKKMIETTIKDPKIFCDKQNLSAAEEPNCKAIRDLGELKTS